MSRTHQPRPTAAGCSRINRVSVVTRDVEFLEQSASLARSLADSLCKTPNGYDHCGALHAVWPDLRLLKLAAEPERHAAFYREALERNAASAPRVLVSGCADWGMLAAVISAYCGTPLDVTTIDRCPTPLLLCAWYGGAVGMPVRTAVADAILFDEYDAYDVVCTHSLLTYYALDGRERLVSNWQRLLRRGGAVVTVTRLAEQTTPIESIKARAARFGELVVQRAVELGIDRDRTILRARAERFAAAQISHPVGNERDVRALFEAQGFAVTRFEKRQLEGGRDPISGAARSGAYAEIVAVKR
jgi:SAM-dependent methyltransferase